MALAKLVVGLTHAMLRRNKQDATQRCVYKWIKYLIYLYIFLTRPEKEPLAGASGVAE